MNLLDTDFTYGFII